MRLLMRARRTMGRFLHTLRCNARNAIRIGLLQGCMRRLKLARSSAGVRWKDVLFSLHLKATMMKISDPIMFGHCVKAPWLSGESSCQHGPGRSSSVSNVSSQLQHAVSPFTITIYSNYAVQLPLQVLPFSPGVPPGLLQGCLQQVC